MNFKRKINILLIITLFVGVLFSPAENKKSKKTIGVYDSLMWKSIRGAKISRNGMFFAYTLSPNLGISETIIKNMRTGKEYKFSVGKINSYYGNKIEFSYNSDWVAFYEYPSKEKEKKIGKNLILLNLKTGKKQDFKDVSTFSFSNKNPNWIAIKKENLNKKQPKKVKESGEDSGSDLILINLKSKKTYNIGNVKEYAFNKNGTLLSYTVSAKDLLGNGLYVVRLNSFNTILIDSSKAEYKSLSWDKKLDYLTVLRGKESEEFKDKVYDIVGVKFNLRSKDYRKYVISAKNIRGFPEGFSISPHRKPYFSKVYDAIVFGIYKPEKKENKNDKKEKNKKKEKDILEDLKLPSLIIWHYKDRRLQSMQRLQAEKDKKFSYLSIYHLKNKKFVRLSDERVKDVKFSPLMRYAIGYDNEKYELEANLSGKRFADIYSIEPLTGKRKLLLKKIRWLFQPSRDGMYILYYRDKNFYSLSLKTGKSYNLTGKIPSSFVDVEADINVKAPPVRQYGFGWSKSGRFLLLYDGWDVWYVEKDGKRFKKLTLSGKENGIRYLKPFIIEHEFEGFDERKPLYLFAYGEWSKKTGILRLSIKNSKKRRQLLWGDFWVSGLIKAEGADVFVFRKETFKDYPDYYITDSKFKNFRKITDANPQQKNYLWGSGRILITYKNSEGRKLQAALFLPLNYIKGRKYPTIVYIYEKLSQNLNRYQFPREFGFSVPRYTSSGYAVLMPDIVYKVNDPGRSSVDCILSAVKASVKTGIVDEERLAIHGHSWGGYQTAFIITQTNIFKAAVAGAPLTNLISMYSSIYWNTGSCNQPIFESSQGRFKGGYWDYFKAYLRNSPVHNIKGVNTPLLILHNDKDGAVDWNQGIEYYNSLRRLHKLVVMLEYEGENHGLRRKENRIDYGIRMKEFFDHFLLGKPEPEWLKNGILYINLKKHLKERKKIIKEM